MNIKKILNNLGIKYTPGPTKNVSVGIIGVSCPFCGDSSNHLGIFPSGGWSCWKCKRTGNLYQLLNKLKGISLKDYRLLVGLSDNFTVIDESKLQHKIQHILKRSQIKVNPISLVIPVPPEAQFITINSKWPSLLKWLDKRKFTLADCQNWEAMYADGGEYNHRIIFPIQDESGNYVGFQSRDVTGLTNLKYKGPSEFKIHNQLYGLDKAGKQVIIVEGVLDAWRVGENAVASFNKSMSMKQREILYNNVEEIIIAWDGDAYVEMMREARWWSGISFPVRMVKLPKGYDPDKFILEKGKEAWNQLLNS